MAPNQPALLELAELVQRADSGDLMRRLLETMPQSLVDAQATAHIGAEPHERTDARTNQRNGSHPKTVTTTSDNVPIMI
jgi:putative transposase